MKIEIKININFIKLINNLTYMLTYYINNNIYFLLFVIHYN
jgi:hypothetical protein